MKVVLIRSLVFSAACALAIAASTMVTDTQEVVELRLRGRYYTEPANVRITVAVEPDDKNRMLVVEADGEKLFRSSEVPLEGKDEQKIHTVEFKNLPAGNYVIRAEVRSSTENVRGFDQRLVVVGDPAADER